MNNQIEKQMYSDYNRLIVQGLDEEAAIKKLASMYYKCNDEICSIIKNQGRLT